VGQAPRRPPSPETPPDGETSFALVARARAGDKAALDLLCARYLPRLQRWAHGRLPVWARGALDTHDLVQDTLANVVRRLHSFKPRHEAAFQAYVRQALMNRIRDEVRRARRHPPGESLDPATAALTPSPLEQAIGREALARYESALQRLKPEERATIIARLEMGFSHAEIAEALGKPSAAAVHMMVSRALVRLAREMARSQPARVRRGDTKSNV
jgi:RNA polymerase sigma-70 factor (ECF subfamily)